MVAAALLTWGAQQLKTCEPGNVVIVALGLKNPARAASGWYDAQCLEHSGPEGGPVQMQATTIDASTLSVEHRNALKAALLAAKRAEARD